MEWSARQIARLTVEGLVAAGFDAEYVDNGVDDANISIAGVTFNLYSRYGRGYTRRLHMDYDTVPRPNSSTVVARVTQRLIQQLSHRIEQEQRRQQRQTEAEQRETARREAQRKEAEVRSRQERLAKLAKKSLLADSGRRPELVELLVLAWLRDPEASPKGLHLMRQLLETPHDNDHMQVVLDFLEEYGCSEELLEAAVSLFRE